MTDVVSPAPVEEPADEQPTGTPIVQDEVSDWGNDITFVEPGATTETGEEVEREVEPEKEATDTDVVTPPVVDVPVAPPVTTAPIVQVPDPGEFKPQDYSFNITIKGKPVKVASTEQAEELASDAENFDTPAQLLAFMRATQKMENGVENDKATWERSKAAYDQQQEASQAQAQQLQTIAAELNYLTQRGDLPPIADTYKNHPNWRDPLVVVQPGVRETVALLDYMAAENDRRAKAGLTSRVSVLDAYNGWKIEEAKSKASKDKDTAGKQRKAASARVAGTSAAPVANVPKGISVGRVGNLNNLGSNWN